MRPGESKGGGTVLNRGGDKLLECLTLYKS